MTSPNEQKIKQIANSWQDKRYRFLRILYEESGGSTLNDVPDEVIKQRAGLTEDEFQTIVDYYNHSLVEAIQICSTNITQVGIDELERTINHPNRPSRYFSPVVIKNYNFYSSIAGGVQIEGQNNNQEVLIDNRKDEDQ